MSSTEFHSSYASNLSSIERTLAADQTQQAETVIAQVAQVEAGEKEAAADSEGNFNPAVLAKKIDLQATDKSARVERRTSTGEDSESIFQAIDPDQSFGEFNQRDQNRYFKLPQKDVVALAKELKLEDPPEKILEKVKRFVGEIDPVCIHKTFEFLTFLLTQEIKTQEPGPLREQLEKLRDTVHFAREEFFDKASEEVKRAIRSQEIEGFMLVASEAVDLQEAEQLSILTQTVVPELKEMKIGEINIGDGKVDLIMKENIMRDITDLVEHRAPDSEKVTVDKAFTNIISHLEKLIEDQENPPTEADKQKFINIHEAVVQTKATFRIHHAAELKIAADKSQPLKDIMMKMRHIVFNDRKLPEAIWLEYKDKSNGYKIFFKDAHDLFHFIGKTIKAKGLDKGELGRLNEACKDHQALVGMFKAVGKMNPAILTRMIRSGVVTMAVSREVYHAHINTQTLGKLFMEIIQERYPSREKLLQMAARLVEPMGGDRWEALNLRIAVLTIMRDLVKQVSPTRMYRTIQHRDDLFLAVIEALEDLEDDLDMLEAGALDEEASQESGT